jgi:hypothetical protein
MEQPGRHAESVTFWLLKRQKYQNRPKALFYAGIENLRPESTAMVDASLEAKSGK